MSSRNHVIPKAQGILEAFTGNASCAAAIFKLRPSG